MSRFVLLSMVCASLVTLGCDDDDSGGRDTGSDTGSDAAQDTERDTPADTAEDISADVSSDTGSDTTDTAEDTLLDSTDTAEEVGDVALDGADIAEETGEDGDVVEDVTDEDAVAQEWHHPTCDEVTGFPALTFSDDEGLTLADNAGSLDGIAYSHGLAALTTPNTLLATHSRNATVPQSAIWISRDAGCTWEVLDEVDNALFLTLTAAPQGVAYAWTDNGNGLYRIEDEEVVSLRSPTPTIRGLGVDPDDAAHLLLGAYDATDSGYVDQLYESTDGGDEWEPVGVPADEDEILITYRYAFDPNDLDHVIVGNAHAAWVTFDRGTEWFKATGFAPLEGDVEGRANVFSIVISPVDPDIAWAMAINIEETLDEPPLEGRYIYGSTDGGLTWEIVVEHDPAEDITLVNGPVMAAHPTDADVVYFVFGTYFDAHGTNLYRYDAADLDTPLTFTHSDYDEYSSLAFPPGDGSLIYVGLTEEGGAD